MSIPNPLVPPDCDVRSFAYMPLDVSRLLKSDTWRDGTPEQRAACISLWCESWTEVPAGSLPDNDKILAKLADVPNWKRVRDYVLAGWVKCSDGRLYHPVVCQKAMEAWSHKRKKSDAGRKGNSIRWESQTDRTAIPEVSQCDTIGIPISIAEVSQQNGAITEPDHNAASAAPRIATEDEVGQLCSIVGCRQSATDYRDLNRLFAAGLDMPEITSALKAKVSSMGKTAESLGYFDKFWREYLTEKPALPEKRHTPPKRQLAERPKYEQEPHNA